MIIIILFTCWGFIITFHFSDVINIIFKVIGELKSTDAVFCGDICGNVCAAGCGDGNLLCYNLDTMECAWGYGCEKKGGIKFVKFVPEKMKRF